MSLGGVRDEGYFPKRSPQSQIEAEASTRAAFRRAHGPRLQGVAVGNVNQCAQLGDDCGVSLTFLLWVLPEPHPRTSSVFVDELDAGLFRCPCTNGDRGRAYFRVARRGFRKRTPSPVPFSSMNSIPADSSACRMAASFGAVTGISPSITSTRRIVATPTFDRRAKSSALHRSIARAARI
jgi:hypothetical protein